MANNDSVEYRLFDTDLTSVLGILPAAQLDLYLQLNEPGSGMVKIPLKSNIAPSVTSGQFVEGRYRGAARSGFFVENIGKERASSGEGAAQLMALAGRGAMALLDDAMVWDDGTGSTQRNFSGTKAGILITLIQEAQNRGGLSVLDYDFSDTEDSDAETWTDDEPLSFNVGVSLLDVMRQIAKSGIDFKITPDGSGNFVLSAYKNGLGSNKSGTVYFRVGQNCEEVSSLEAGGDIRNVLKVKYQHGFTTVKNNASIAARRRREGLLDAGYAGNSNAAATFGAAELDLKKDPKHQISVKIYDGIGPRAFVDYDLGDTITLDIEGSEQEYRIRGIQLGWSNNQYADVIVDLNSLILENDIRMAQDIEWLKDMWESARDANLLEVRHWAAIGDKNITYSVNQMLIVGSNLYVANSINSSLLIYDMDRGGWTRVLIPLAPTCLANVGTDIYIGASTGKIYKYSGGTITEVGEANYSSDPGAVTVLSMTSIGTKIYCGGIFDDIDSVPMTGIAEYDTVGDSWADIGGGTGTLDMVSDGSTLYATFGAQVKSWNGSSWSNVGSAFSLAVLALAVYDSGLLAGNAQTGGIFQWDGATWSTFEGGVNGAVYAIAVSIADVYIGGAFTDVGNHIARCSGGEWIQLEEGTNNNVSNIVLNDQDVYVAGSFTTAGDKTALKIAAYFSTFDSLVDYLEHSEGSFNLGEAIHSATAKTSLTGADEIPLWDSISQALRKITWTNIIASIKTWADTIYVSLTGNQNVAGVKTFSSFPVSPYSAPTADYEFANKKYVDDNSGGGGGTPGGSDTEVQFNDGGAFGGDSEFTFDQVTKALGLGDPTLFPATLQKMLWMVGDDESPAVFGVSYGSDKAPFIAGLKADGTGASPTNVKDDQVLYRIRGRGYDGSVWTETRAEIRFVADGDWGTSDHPTRIEVWTTPDGSGTLTLAMTIGSDGNVNIASGKEYQVNGSQHTHEANAGLFEARLSLSSTNAVETSDLTGQGTIYLHPYKGYRIALYDGSKWVHHDLSSAISLAFSGLSFSATCYDLFVYDSSGLTLEAVAWTNATTRATALGKQDGIEVKAADPTRRYCGTVYIDSSKQASMEYQIAGNTTTIGRRHVWNRYNRIYQSTRKVSTTSHTYSSSTYRKWNNTDVMSIEMVIGIQEDDISIYAGGNQNSNANLDVAVNWSSGGGELVDWFNPTASGISAFTGGHLRMQRAGVGLNTFNVIESASSGTATFSTAVVDIGCFS